MKSRRVLNAFALSGILLGGASIAPVKAVPSQGESRVDLSAASTLVSSSNAGDLKSLDLANELNLPTLNSKTLSIQTGRDQQGNLLVSESGTSQLFEQSTVTKHLRKSTQSLIRR